ncbi:LOW QUALITY PROTEIN: claudin-2 [Sceloporus undulatus]|uniref:LOW QUALITY PROTEIN: claudin-2 n=1 Tax=Sceloporus undulatus TaxID=8520 RepID=UPI001C4C1536|nr:LOW QUALITY PROTEIN: claudin-2 [Sceloporus undulatus]
MASVGLQLVGYILGLLGLLGTVIATLLPGWKTSSYIGTSIVTAVGFSKGLWMECASYSTGITQCDIYSSLLNLPADLQAAQALMSTSIAVSLLASIVCVMGMRCTVFAQGSPTKDRVAVAGGAAFILGGLLAFIPVVWNIHVVLRDFYNPVIPDSMKYELGEALYLGILSSLVSLVGGLILCASCPPQDRVPTHYSPYRSRTVATRSPPSPTGGAAPSQKTKSEFNAYNLTGYV